MRIKELARSGAIFERTGESSGIQGGMQWLAAPGLMLCAYGRVEGLSVERRRGDPFVRKEVQNDSASLYTRYSQRVCAVCETLRLACSASGEDLYWYFTGI